MGKGNRGSENEKIGLGGGGEEEKEEEEVNCEGDRTGRMGRIF